MKLIFAVFLIFAINSNMNSIKPAPAVIRSGVLMNESIVSNIKFSLIYDLLKSLLILTLKYSIVNLILAVLKPIISGNFPFSFLITVYSKDFLPFLKGLSFVLFLCRKLFLPKADLRRISFLIHRRSL